MMPAYCPQSAPPGEKALYAALAASADTEDWTVLHSVGIAEHVRQVEGEADFTVVAPGAGILVIEVKSHLSVRRTADGLWHLGSRPPSSRSPFQQAGEAMHSLHDYLTSRNIDLRLVPVCYAVWFTSARARAALPQSPEWHDWQVLDSEDLRAGAAAAVRRTLRAGADHLRGKTGRFSAGGAGLTAESAGRIASALRPRFEVAMVAADRRRDREEQLIAFIDEQYAALDAMQDNRAVLFTGPAGSGKTLLAMEAARREAAQGRTGRLLCFNRLLSHKIAAGMGQVPGLAVGTLHGELLRVAGISAPADADPGFWSERLPELAADALLGSTVPATDDFLVIDEVQDIARTPYLDVLDLVVKGGFSGGRVLLFGDFERQALYGAPDGRDLIRKRIAGLTMHRLTVNCRNLPRIGHIVESFAKLEPGFRRFRRLDDGVNPSFEPFRSGEDQSPALVRAINALRGEDYKLNEITVLSPLASGSTAQSTADPWLRQVLRPATGSGPRRGQVQYSTIHAFKGLEAPAVIVTDLDDRLVPDLEPLLYVGLTRAMDRLVALIEIDTFQRWH
jgi:hypothetical protein